VWQLALKGWMQQLECGMWVAKLLIGTSNFDCDDVM